MTSPESSSALDSAAAAVELSEKSFARFATFIHGELGIKMPQSKLSMVQNRLLRRVRDLGLGSVENYTEYFFAAASGQEREHFINAITTNKTDFFREPEHFRYLTATVLRSAGSAHFKVWSAGCSSGEEPYTLAMVLSEYAERERGFDFAILATDISTRVLNLARTAIYQKEQIAPVPIELRRKYLLANRDRSDPLVRIVPRLREKVRFHALNFMDEDYGIGDRFDAVFFRNVMIYFDKPTQESVVQKLCRYLNPGGYLFAGHSESLAGLNVPLRLVSAAVYRKI